MTPEPRIQPRIAIAVALVASLALVGFLFETEKPPGSPGPAASPMANGRAERADGKRGDPAEAVRAAPIPRDIAADGRAKPAEEKRGDPAEVARAEAILRDIEGAARDERLRLWKEVDDLRGRSEPVRTFLFHFARDETSGADPYPRFVAAAAIAGFGRPSRIGPNNLIAGTSLAWYISLQRGSPVSGPRRLELDPALDGIKVEVAPNAKNDLTFTEILWTILVRYKLSFRLDPDGTFLILPQPPMA
jgi:hypothetical protein